MSVALPGVNEMTSRTDLLGNVACACAAGAAATAAARARHFIQLRGFIRLFLSLFSLVDGRRVRRASARSVLP
jgi:hypothetical protein